MRILELEISNIRGIRHSILKPEGENFLIWGPNGSGKSAVVDAIDFLLTGEISRLKGKGTAGIKLNKHGPHIDCKPSDAYVKAIITIPHSTSKFEIRRNMAQPSKLICDQGLKAVLQPTLDVAQRGQHVLTRREILKYITSEAGTRAEEIQNLLNISDIENIRKSLIKAKNQIEGTLNESRRVALAAISSVCATINSTEYKYTAIQDFVNKQRLLLNAGPIDLITSSNLKFEVKSPAALQYLTGAKILDIRADIESLEVLTSDKSKDKISLLNTQLKTALKKLRAKPGYSDAISTYNILRLGLDLLKESGECPLCDTIWPQGKLRDYILKKLKGIEEIQKLIKDIDNDSKQVTTQLLIATSCANNVLKCAQSLNLQNEIIITRGWLSKLNSLVELLSTPIDKYVPSEFDTNEIKNVLITEEISNAIKAVNRVAKEQIPLITPEQSAWDNLTRLEENLKAVEGSEGNLKAAELFFKRAVALVAIFEASRNHILEELYDSISSKFSLLYKQIHADDESSFGASIKPVGAGLSFEVDFYKRGTHPPHALHSEGHQDSMGLCLFLALSERLTNNLMEIIILDDVVMSVDSEHRRHICKLLKSMFSFRQFIITTHDRTWANQLKSEKVITNNNILEFYNWSVDTGPSIHYSREFWDLLYDDLRRSDVPSAASRLRRGLEEYFSTICDSLQAKVVFKINNRWELGDLLPAAVNQYKSWLKQAKRASQSWNDKQSMAEIEVLEQSINAIYLKTNAEQWAVNASVHYNQWYNLGVKDFKPVALAFRDLLNIFTCETCNSMLHITKKENTPSNLRCQCSKFNLNLLYSD